jgi:hypothetical protein
MREQKARGSNPSGPFFLGKIGLEKFPAGLARHVIPIR